MTTRSTALLLFSLLGAGAALAKNEGYHLAKTVPVPGTATYYDFLRIDPAARRLYVSNGAEVAVLDADKHSVLGSLTGSTKVHGMAMANNRVFVTDGGGDRVRVYDAATFKPLAEIPTGKNPDDILYDPGTAQIFSFNHSAGTVTVIDPAAMKATGTIEVPGALEVGRADGKGTVWVNAEDKSELVKLDVKKKTVVARWPLAPCEEPTGLAFDPKNRRLFVGCSNKLLAVVDADKGKVVATVPIGLDVDGTDFDLATKTVFASCGGEGGSLAVIRQVSADKYTLVTNVVTQPRAKTLALDPKTHRVFLSTASFGPAPAPTGKQPAPRQPVLPGTLRVLVVDP
jgi:YVTN family beta-propeller protein